ncbi:MAG TPA: hypothetical protein VII94_04185 [Candidatus Saccharimonadales bacterium]
MENPICPVCSQPLLKDSITPNMYACIRRKIWTPELCIYLDIVDYSVLKDVNGGLISERYQVAPYDIFIFNNQTEIRQVMSPMKQKGAKIFKSEIILTIAAPLKIQAPTTKQKIIERIKMLVLFS